MDSIHYYEGSLSKADRAVYYAIAHGLDHEETSIVIPRISPTVLNEIWQKIHLDHPEIFYAQSYRYRCSGQADSYELIPDYLFIGKQLKAQRQAVEARVMRLIRPALAMTDTEKEKFIHDFICTQVHYDKLKKPYSHEVYGPLSQGVGVCEGIAKTVKLLCDRLNLPCIVVLCGNNPEKSIQYGHMWNLIHLNGRYYHLDCTFDLTLSRCGQLRYDYFNLADEQVFRDHEPSVYAVPSCPDSRGSRYRTERIALSKEEDISKRTLQAAKKNRPYLFQWIGNYLTHEMFTRIVNEIYAAAESCGKEASISVNYPQAVFYIVFSDKQASGVILEHSNEGELYEGAQ